MHGGHLDNKRKEVVDEGGEGFVGHGAPVEMRHGLEFVVDVELLGWVDGWVDGWVEENEAVGMRCCVLGFGWVGGWVGGYLRGHHHEAKDIDKASEGGDAP